MSTPDPIGGGTAADISQFGPFAGGYQYDSGITGALSAPPPTSAPKLNDGPSDVADIKTSIAERQRQADDALASMRKRQEQADKIQEGIVSEQEQQRGLREQYIQSLQQEMEQSQNAKYWAPKDELQYVYAQSPLLLLVTAFSSGAFRKASVGALSALNGMVQGIQKGSDEQYQQASAAYDNALKSMQQQWAMRDKIFEQMQGIYGDDIQGQLRAWQVANAAIEVDQRTATEAFNHIDQLRTAEDRILQENQARKSKQAEGQLSPAALELEAKLFVSDPNGSGRWTQAQRDQIINYLAAKGYTIEDIISGRAKTKMYYAEARTIATQAANLGRVEKALTDPGGVGDQAVEAAKALSSAGAFRGFQSWSQWFNKQFSDPTLAAYQVKMIALRDEYATVINKGGTPTEGSRQQANEAMDAYQPEAVPAIVAAIKQITQANQRALQEQADELGRPVSLAPRPLPPLNGAATEQSQPSTFDWTELK